MEMDFLILGVTCFDGEFEGKRYKNSKIIYLPDEYTDSPNRKGLIPVTCKANYDCFSQISDLPAIYTCKVQLVPNARGASMEIQSILSKVSNASIS